MSVIWIDSGRFAAAGGWTPAQISTALWFDETSHQIVSGAASQWNDKSGNNRHITQSTAIQRPAFVSNAFNNLPALQFDGSNDVLSNASVGAGGLSNVTVFAVFRQDAGGSSEDHQINIGQTGTQGKVRGFYRASNESDLRFGGWVSIATSTFTLDIGGSHHIFGFRVNALSGAGNVTLYKDGSSQTLTTTAALSTTLDGFSVGSLIGSLVGTYYSAITVAEVLVWYSAINDATVDLVQGYAAHKWGLIANLPAGHPYKTTPP